MTIESTLTRIADALDRAFPPTAPGEAPAADPAPAPRKTRAAKNAETVAAVLKPADPAPTAQTDVEDFLGDDDTAPAVKLTKDHVRAVVVAYQKLPNVGEDKARALVVEHSTSGTLKSIPEDKYPALVAKAKAAGVNVDAAIASVK